MPMFIVWNFKSMNILYSSFTLDLFKYSINWRYSSVLGYTITNTHTHTHTHTYTHTHTHDPGIIPSNIIYKMKSYIKFYDYGDI